MLLSNLQPFENEIVHLGNQISSWRNEASYRQIHDEKAFKTSADARAHTLLSSIINKNFPDIPILSEEDSEHSDERPSQYWLIDPIDGTASWFGGFPGFVTQAAYIENNIPVYGVVYAPIHQKLWSAQKGNGAKLNGKKMDKLTASDQLNLVDNYPTPKHVAARIAKNLPITNYIESGSLGLKCCLVAEGTADVFAKDVVIRDWDIAPAAVIISEVGGYLCDLNGREINFFGSFNKNDGLLVTRSEDLAMLVIESLKNSASN